MIGALDVLPDEGVDRVVARDFGARLDLHAAVTVEGRLGEDLARQPHRGRISVQSSGWLM